jgi:hypothetical protein
MLLFSLISPFFVLKMAKCFLYRATKNRTAKTDLTADIYSEYLPMLSMLRS